jgi:hypothetical protein
MENILAYISNEGNRCLGTKKGVKGNRCLGTSG